jgi:hypothetical protein
VVEEGTMDIESVYVIDGDVNNNDDVKEESTVHIKRRRKSLVDNNHSNTIGSL